jgi:hypothetical protein
MKDGLPIRELLFSLIFNLATQPSVYGRFTVHKIQAYEKFLPGREDRFKVPGF